MRLETISVYGQDGLKGWTGKLDLFPVTLIWGPNGAGKTSRLLAVLAGLRGVAETPADPVREYLGTEAPRATVDLMFDGHRFSRSLAESARTAAGKRTDGAAEAICGPHLVRWDLADFAAGNDQARQRLLDRVCDLGASGWTVERIRADLGEGLVAAKLLVEVPLTGRLEVWAALAQAWAREEYTRVNAEQRRLTAEADALATGDGEVSADSLPKLDAELAPLREQQARAKASTADLDRAMAAHRRYRSQVDAERATVARLERELAELPPSVELPDLASLQAVVAGARESDAQASARVRELQTQIREARAARLATGRLANDDARCRHCDAADPLGIRVEMERYDETIRGLEGQLDDAESDAEIERTMRSGVEEALVDANRAHRFAEVARTNGELLTAARVRLAELEAHPVEAPATSPSGTADLERQIAALQTRRDRVIRGQERERQFQLAVGKRDAAVERFAQVKALGAKLKELREQMAEAAFRPLQIEASAITSPVLGGEVVFRSAAEFGVQRAGRFVPWWSLSDGERAVTAAALSYAFARLAGAPWRAVILDGAEVIDPARLRVLLEVLVAKTRLGDLDNAIVACRADTRPDAPGGVEVVGLATRVLEVA